MLCIVVRIVARHDPPDDVAAATREKQRRVAVLVERMLLAIEELLPLDDQRRHPRRIVGVDLPREFDERVAFRCRRDFGDYDVMWAHRAVAPAVVDSTTRE